MFVSGYVRSSQVRIVVYCFIKNVAVPERHFARLGRLGRLGRFDSYTFESLAVYLIFFFFYQVVYIGISKMLKLLSGLQTSVIFFRS